MLVVDSSREVDLRELSGQILPSGGVVGTIEGNASHENGSWELSRRILPVRRPRGNY